MPEDDPQLKALNDRFDRFESNVMSKLDLLTDAMVKLARTEEKLVAMENDRTNMHNRMNRFSEKLDNVERKSDDNTRTVATVNKLFWICITAMVGTILATFFGVGPT